MMIKCHIWTISTVTFLWTFFINQILILNVESFKLKCPAQAHWKLRAKANCTNTLKYYCLFNYIKEKYVEGCDGPDWDRKGSKRIYAGSFTRGKCTQERYQPYKFWTNGSMSDCIYAKSICSEDGQIVYIDDSRKADRTCRCDYKRNYSFVKIPRQLCYCIPTEEDCSCFMKACPVNFTLSADYECIPSNSKEKPKCIGITRSSETKDEETSVLTEKDYLRETSSNSKWSAKAAGSIVIFLCFIHIIGGFCFFVLFESWTREKMQTFYTHFRREHTDNANDGESKERLDVEVPQQINLFEPTLSELNHLRIIHLLFRVACPVVRLVFNHEIKPTQLRKTLDQNKVEMEKYYRKKEIIISDSQWDLLFKGNPVNSDDFDIRLMVYLIRTVTDIEVGDLYPIITDKSIGAQLSRIKYIRNEATRSVGRTLPEIKFQQYWDDIGQAVLKLVSLQKHAIVNDEANRVLIDRLFGLNPLYIDSRSLCKFIYMSEKYPATILQHLISEYCKLNKQTIETLLKEEKHNLYHKRIKTESCCKCHTEFSTYWKIIPEKKWEALYEMNERRSSHSCVKNLKTCSEFFFPRNLKKCDLSMSLTIILNIPNVLKHVLKRFCTQNFLTNNKHTLFHSMEEKMCCMCSEASNEKTVMARQEWNKLYKKNKNMSCKLGYKECCCQYSARREIKYSNMDENFWSKIFHIAGPISVLYKIEQNAFLYFLNWIVDDQPLNKVLIDLLNTSTDKEFRISMMQKISSFNRSVLDTTTQENVEARKKWVSTHVRDNKAITEPQLQIIVHNKDGLNVNNVHIPKGVPLPQKKKFTDLTPEENNFLVIVYGLTKIVYPVIKNELDKLRPGHKLDEICMSIYGEYCKDMCKGKHKGRRNRIYLTHIQREQLFSPNLEESNDFDLKLMIYILIRNFEKEEKTNVVEQLKNIDKIRREIVQSSSGVLTEEKFKDTTERITKAVLHFGEITCEEKHLLMNLHQIRKILG